MNAIERKRCNISSLHANARTFCIKDPSPSRSQSDQDDGFSFTGGVDYGEQIAVNNAQESDAGDAGDTQEAASEAAKVSGGHMDPAREIQPRVASFLFIGHVGKIYASGGTLTPIWYIHTSTHKCPCACSMDMLQTHIPAYAIPYIYTHTVLVM